MFFKGKLQNIVIYQQSHHGFNNAKDAIDILGLNRSDIYAVASAGGTFTKSNALLRSVSYNYSLSNVPEDHKFDSANEQNGVYCRIKFNGSAVCKDY